MFPIDPMISIQSIGCH